MDQNANQQVATSIPTTQVPPSPPPPVPNQSISHPPTQNYFARLFSGRMNRRNFIIGILFLLCIPICLLLLNFLISFLLGFLFPSMTITNLSLTPNGQLPNQGAGNIVNSILTILFTLAAIVWLIFFIISLFSFMIRRLHDLNKSGWLCLLHFVPIVNVLFDIYITFFPGTIGENKYGTQPIPRLNLKQDILKLS